MSLFVFSFSLVDLRFVHLGLSCFLVAGIVDLNLLFINNCAGDPMFSNGVFRFASKFKYGSFPSCLAFCSNRLTLCTKRSASPFDYW